MFFWSVASDVKTGPVQSSVSDRSRTDLGPDRHDKKIFWRRKTKRAEWSETGFHQVSCLCDAFSGGKRPFKILHFSEMRNFGRPFTPQGWLQSASNFAKTRFRWFPTFHFSTPKKISTTNLLRKNFDQTNFRRRKMKRRESSETRFPKVWGRMEPSSGGKRPFKILQKSDLLSPEKLRTAEKSRG